MKTGNGKTGRPIGFDKDAALEAATLFFGNAGTKELPWPIVLGDGFNPSSIYAAFGESTPCFSSR